ncbi:hypothetical protein PYW07_017080 [Mythimna separata]|uniref:Cathepsin propeptide inhibitor domain-containing protein n=1 Tax=Mythimna separata TaxID=271217 RepID=A0AAD7YXE4_MYTSE|nr:hypothetical protein PYW07_017080 [Mythimna separata]
MASAATYTYKPHYDLNNAKVLFEDFINEYNKNYKDEADKGVHYQAFVKNLKKINKMNEDDSSDVFAINKLTDYTEEEMENMYGLKRD